MITTYIMIFDENKERWYYFKRNFKTEQERIETENKVETICLECDCIEYYIDVEDDIIISDTFEPLRVGKEFNKIYGKCDWRSYK